MKYPTIESSAALELADEFLKDRYSGRKVDSKINEKDSSNVNSNSLDCEGGDKEDKKSKNNK